MNSEDFDPEIARAFHCSGPIERLAGGEGRSRRVGDCVFKPIDNLSRHNWACDLLQRLPNEEFRVAQPRRAAAGSYGFRDWGASTYEPGEHLAGRWEEKLQVSQAFHTSLNKLHPAPMPPGDDVWSQAHELAWQRAPLPASLHPDIVHRVEILFTQYQALPRGGQIIHADICGNILFHEQLAPCVIDFSPAYGSMTYAEAILIADAVAWEGAPLKIINLVLDIAQFRQHLLRAINFRILVPALREPKDSGLFLREYFAFEPLINFLLE